MTTQELRELDAFILLNVLKFEGGNTNDLVLLGMHPEFTTDHAAAMMVLEVCIKRSELSISLAHNSVMNFSCCEIDGQEDTFNMTCAETLPLVICKFARKLFGGSE